MGRLDLIRIAHHLHSRAPSSARSRICAALMSAALLGAASPAAAQTAIKFSLDEPFEAAAAIFLLPQDKGYFRNEGLDVSIEPGNTPTDPIARVASGEAQMGFADINALIRYHEQNPAAAVKAVYMVYNTAPYAVVARKSRGVAEVKDLEGKKVGAPPTSLTAAQWPLFAKLAAIDAGKVSLENVGVPVRAPMLAAGQLDAVLGYSFRVYIDVKERGVAVDDIVLLPMANYGMKLYGSAIIVNSKFAATDADAVSGFLRAFQRGLRDALRNPTSAVDSVLKREDGARKDVTLERLRMVLRDNIVTPEVRANGFGGIDPARFGQAIDQLALVTKFKTKPKLDDIFDASFLPAANDRKVN
jgi:NitT/TauT family transport system substrate-binding protein